MKFLDKQFPPEITNIILSFLIDWKQEYKNCIYEINAYFEEKK